MIVPPADYLPRLRQLCDEHDVLLIADEIQSGLARTGELLACQHADVRADLYTLGKALGGGILPVSAVVGRDDVIGVLRPGEHGSTFGGNPLACAVGRAVIRLLRTGEFQQRSRELGEHMHRRLRAGRRGVPRSAVEACGQVWRSPGQADRAEACKHCWPRACCARDARVHARTPRLW